MSVSSWNHIFCNFLLKLRNFFNKTNFTISMSQKSVVLELYYLGSKSLISLLHLLTQAPALKILQHSLLDLNYFTCLSFYRLLAALADIIVDPNPGNSSAFFFQSLHLRFLKMISKANFSSLSYSCVCSDSID
jgi:hypothetical protein